VSPLTRPAIPSQQQCATTLTIPLSRPGLVVHTARPASRLPSNADMYTGLLVVFMFFFMVCAHRAFQIGIRGSKKS
jgi:hypothetical protein